MVDRRLTWIVLIGILALLVVAGIDALRGSGSESASVTPGATTPAETAALDICGPEQLMLRIERLDADLALALRNVTETPCRARRLPIKLTLLDRKGLPIQTTDRHGLPVEITTNIQRAFPPAEYSPDVDVITGFAVLYECGQAQPYLYAAEAGSYHAGGRLPHTDSKCLKNPGP